MAIIRKWLIPSIEELTHKFFLNKVIVYRQAFLCTDPEAFLSEAYYEGFNEYVHKFTMQDKHDLNRLRVEKVLTIREFTSMAEMGKLSYDQFIHEEIYEFLWNAYILHVHEVDSELPTHFNYLEIEFHSEAEALTFNIPDIFGEEITDNSDYRMVNYWARTRKQIA